MNADAIDSSVRRAFEMGDEAAFLSANVEWKKVSGQDHPLYATYRREIEEGENLSRQGMAMAAPSIHSLYEH